MKEFTNNLPIVETLEPRLLLSGSVLESALAELGDLGNTFGQASEISPQAGEPTTVSGQITSFQDLDYVKFVAPVTGGLTATMVGASGLNSVLCAYSDAFRRLASNNDLARGNPDARVNFFVEEGRTYYLCARGTKKTAGEYELSLRFAADGHGNTAQRATTVTLSPEGQSVQTGAIDYMGDKDFFRFVAPSDGGLTLSLSALGSSVDACLVVYNASSRVLASHDNLSRSNRNAELNLAVRSGETYYISAQAARRTIGAYQLAFALSVDEQGDTFAGAQTITLDENGQATVLGAINYRNDVDYFAFTAEESTSLTVCMHDVDAAVRPQLSVWNAQGRRLQTATGSAGGSAVLTWNVQAGQRYYIRAASASAGRGEYVLDFDLLTDDHGNDAAGATALTLAAGGTTTVSGVIDYASDRDFFVFTAAQAGAVRATMSAAPGSSLDSYLTIRNASGTILVSNDDSNGTLNSAVAFTVDAGARYYVQAHAFGSSTGAYTLSLTFSADEFGGSLAAAATIALNESGGAVVDGGIQFGGDNDYLAFFASATADMTLTLARTGGTLQPSLAVYNHNGQLLTSGAGTASVPASVALSVVQGAKYYVRLCGAGASETGTYRLTLQTIVPDPAPSPDPDLPDPAPGTTVTAVVYNTGSGLVLRVLGTNGNDTIVVSQTSSSVSVTGSLTYSYNAAVSAIELYGFDGDDILRTTYSATAVAHLYGGAGNDTIYENGQGRGYSYGEAGDDLIVSVGGGQDTVLGGNGTDSFWIDSSDTSSDVVAAETSSGAVHRIASFYQPYTSNSAGADYVSLEIAGQNLRDPTYNSYAAGWANFSHLAVFNNGPQYNDIKQGSLGDCYFLAAASSLAQTDPFLVRQMVTALGDGTFAVRYYNGSTEVYLRIDGDLPVTSGGSLVYARTSSTSEIWVPLLEKAYAHFRYGQNSYASIEGGWMDVVYRQMTGHSAEFRYTSGTTSALATYLRDHLNAGHAVTLGSYSNASSPVVGSHAYQVVSIDADNYVTVYNPWGVDGRTWDSNSSDGLLRLSISQIQANYIGVCVSLA